MDELSSSLFFYVVIYTQNNSIIIPVFAAGDKSIVWHTTSVAERLAMISITKTLLINTHNSSPPPTVIFSFPENFSPVLIADVKLQNTET